MAKNETPAAPAVAAQDAPRLTLSEFCTRLSESVSRPELIGGFEFLERRANRLKDTAAAYQGRFDAFLTTPV